MRNLVFLFFIGFIITMSSCRKDFDFEPSNGGLAFSRDTVYLDTVFTNIGSSTYTLKVYNKSNKNISIPSIKLGKGTESKYRMTVDGMQGDGGKIFNNIELLAKDSLYIFIETTASIADANPTDFLYTDQIQFGAGTTLQSVELVTLIQDAIFLYPQRNDEGVYENLMIGDDAVYGFFLDHNDPINGDEYIFTAQKPYVIYGYAAVASDQALNIMPGARIHFHDSSGIIVANGGRIVALGLPSETESQEKEIIFEGDRLEPGFSDTPGQWGAIWLTSGSGASEFDHVTIKNGIFGLYIQNNAETVSIKNTQIYDCSNYGILAETAKIVGENIVINNAGQATLACSLGGNYRFTHCTFNNSWPSSQQVAVQVDNGFIDDDLGPQPFALTQARFTNCIIWGSNQIELRLSKIESSEVYVDPVFEKCLIKFNAGNQPIPELYAFTNDENQIRKTGNPDFMNVNNNQLLIGEESAALDFGVITLVPRDVLNFPRIPGPQGGYDLGAYQHVIFE